MVALSKEMLFGMKLITKLSVFIQTYRLCQELDLGSHFLAVQINVNNDTNMERLSQYISFISNTSSFTLTYYDKILSDEGTTHAWDFLYVRIYSGNWYLLQTIDTMDNRSKDLGYIPRSINIQVNPQWVRQTLHLTFEALTDSTNITDFFIDDVGLVTHCY